jgi:hypothetical protein
MSPGMAKNVKDLQTAGYQAEHAKSLALNEHTKAVDWLVTQQNKTYQSALDALNKDPNAAPGIHSFVLQKTAQNAQQIGVDSSKSDDPLNFVTTAAPFAPGEAEKWDVEAQKSWLEQKVKDTTPEAVAQKRAELALQQQKADQDVWEKTPTRDGFARFNKKTGVMEAVDGGFKPPITAAQINLGTGQAHNTGTGVDTSKPLANPQAEGLARDFADGKPQPAITSRTPAWVSDAIARGRQIYAQANGGDEQGYGTTSGVIKKSREAWAPGGAMMNTAAAVDVATGHLAARDQFIEALKNGDAAKMNDLKNYFKTQFNLSTAPNDLRTINGLVAPEIAKVVKGSTNTNESEVQDIRKSLGDDLASEIQKSGGQVFRGAMGTRLENMENQYKVAYPGKSLSRVLLPATVKTFPSVFGNGAQGGAGATPAPAQRITATQANGTKLQLSADGKSWEPMGGK